MLARRDRSFSVLNAKISASPLPTQTLGGILTSQQQPSPSRDTILISHANPEDNEFTLWLALRLASEGYRVWCDLTKLLGGEVFWDDIEAVIRERAAKVLFVLSRSSNNKDGVLREIHLAQGIARKQKIKDFVIPLHIDDLPHGEVTIEVTRVNSIPFEHSWAVGLDLLLRKLSEDGVAKEPQFNATAVNEWWRSKFSAEDGLRREPEEHLSNWFPVTALPERVYFHWLARHGIGKIEASLEALPFPAFQEGTSLITFANAQDFDGKLGTNHYIAQTICERLEDVLAKDSHFYKSLHRILRLAWEQMLKERALPTYSMANGAKTFYFAKNQVPKDKVTFQGVDGAKTWRAMIGHSTRRNPKTGEVKTRIWHFGMEARPLLRPLTAFVLKPHVLFSDDGLKIWDKPKPMAAARRKQCASWWNDEWRDRTLAAMTFLADADGVVRIRLGSDQSLCVDSSPVRFISPVAYTDPQVLKEQVELADDYGRDRDEDEDEREFSEVLSEE